MDYILLYFFGYANGLQPAPLLYLPGKRAKVNITKAYRLSALSVRQIIVPRPDCAAYVCAKLIHGSDTFHLSKSQSNYNASVLRLLLLSILQLTINHSQILHFFRRLLVPACVVWPNMCIQNHYHTLGVSYVDFVPNGQVGLIVDASLSSTALRIYLRTCCWDLEATGETCHFARFCRIFVCFSACVIPAVLLAPIVIRPSNRARLLPGDYGPTTFSKIKTVC